MPYSYKDVYIDLVNKKSNLAKFDEYKDIMELPTIKRFKLFKDDVENIGVIKLLLYNMIGVADPLINKIEYCKSLK